MGSDSHDICMKAKRVLFCCGQQAGIPIFGVCDRIVDVVLVCHICKVVLLTSSAVVVLLRYLCGLDITLLML